MGRAYGVGRTLDGMNRQEVLTWDPPQAPRVRMAFDADGDLVRVGPAEQQGSWLERFAPVVGALSGPDRLGRRELTWGGDVDEVEQRWRVPGTSVWARLRHTVDRTWQVRLVLHNTGPDAERLRVRWEWATGPDAALGLHAAGAQGTFRVAPARAGLPGAGSPGAVVQGELVSGAVEPGAGRVLDLPAGATDVTAWKIDWVDPATAVPVPSWWPRTAIEAGELQVLRDPDIVVPHAVADRTGWTIAPYAGVHRLEVIEATRRLTVELFAAPPVEELVDELELVVDQPDELSPAEALFLTLAARRRGVVSDAVARVRGGVDDPAVRRMLALHAPGAPRSGARRPGAHRSGRSGARVDPELCRTPGFGHGIASLLSAAAGADPAAGAWPPPLPELSARAGVVERADRLLLTAPDAAWDRLMAMAAPVTGAWPLQPWGWDLVEQARWVAVASLARQLGRPGVPDPEPLRRAVLARCHDAATQRSVAALVWLLV